MSLSTKDIALVDGTAQIQFKTNLMIVLTSVPAGQKSDILHSSPQMEYALVIFPQMDARMIIDLMILMLIASSRVISINIAVFSNL